MLDGLGLVVLDANHRLVHMQHLLQDGGTHHHLLALFQEGTEVGGKVRLALATVDDEHFAGLARRRGQFYMRREGGTAQAHDTGQADFLQHGLVVVIKGGHQGVGRIDALHPLVPLDGNLNANLRIAGQVFARPDGLHRTRHGRMDERRYEPAGFGHRLSHLHLVADRHEGLRRRTDVLGHADIHGRRKRQRFNRTAAGNLRILRMHTANRKSSRCHSLTQI